MHVSRGASEAAGAAGRFPVNAYEAESRRISRFSNLDIPRGPMAVGEEKK